MNAEILVSMDRIDRVKKLVSTFPRLGPKLIVKGIIFYADKSPETVDGKTPDAAILMMALDIIEDSYKMPE